MTGDLALQELGRVWDKTVVPIYNRGSYLKFFRSSNIGSIGVTDWAKRMLKKLGKAHMQRAGADFKRLDDAFDFTGAKFKLYDVYKTVTMNREEYDNFSRNGVLPVGTEEVGRVMYEKVNYNLFRGEETGDEFGVTQYNYITDSGTGNGSVDRPLPISSAASGTKWDAAGGVQEDIGLLMGNLWSKGYDPRNSIVFVPTVCASVFAKPIITGSGIYGNVNVLQYVKQQGFLDVIFVKDELLYTAAGANPTVDAFDIYAIDLTSILIGYTMPFTTDTFYDQVTKNYYLDAETRFAPLKIPRYWDDDKYYTGIARVTAIDATT